jgi:hypothetical protein
VQQKEMKTGKNIIHSLCATRRHIYFSIQFQTNMEKIFLLSIFVRCFFFVSFFFFYSFSLLARGEKFSFTFFLVFVDGRATKLVSQSTSTKWKTCRMLNIEFLMAGGVLFVVVY